MENKTEPRAVVQRIMTRVLIVVALYPILLGGVANMPQRYRARLIQMRQEHRDAVERDRARRLLQEMAGQSHERRDGPSHGTR